jgi:hypothetical protein
VSPADVRDGVHEPAVDQREKIGVELGLGGQAMGAVALQKQRAEPSVGKLESVTAAGTP